MNRMHIAEGLGLGLLIVASLTAPAHATESSGSGMHALAIGVMAHDRGFASDEHERGTDLNLEVQFAPMRLFGSPRPHLGATLNFQGETSVAYAGLGFRLRERRDWYADLYLSAALHNGPLHKDAVSCDIYSDCGYGIRLMPRLGFELAYRISPHASLAILYDHMSHKRISSTENEGLDHTGLRYLRTY